MALHTLPQQMQQQWSDIARWLQDLSCPVVRLCVCIPCIVCMYVRTYMFIVKVLNNNNNRRWRTHRTCCGWHVLCDPPYCNGFYPLYIRRWRRCVFSFALDLNDDRKNESGEEEYDDDDGCFCYYHHFIVVVLITVVLMIFIFMSS